MSHMFPVSQIPALTRWDIVCRAPVLDNEERFLDFARNDDKVKRTGLKDRPLRRD